MSNNKDNSLARIPVWLIWIVAGQVLLILAMTIGEFVSIPRDFRRLHWLFQSNSEMTYSVWYSGIVLTIACLIFLSNCKEENRLQIPNLVWYSFALFCLALCADEMGSFHENLINHFGFQGLIPFAVLFGGSLAWGILKCFKNHETRVGAMLVCAALFCFALVGILEVIEQKFQINDSRLKLLRSRFEESLELAGISMLLFGSIACTKSSSGYSRSLVNLIGNWQLIPHISGILFALCAIHFSLYFLTPYVSVSGFKAGNPMSIFPVLVFFLAAMHCFYVARNSGTEKSNLWLTLGWIMIISSLCQIHNPLIVFGKTDMVLISSSIRSKISWASTLVPVVAMMVILLKEKALPYLVGLGVLAFHGILLEYLFDIPPMRGTYYIFSGCVSLSIILLLKKYREIR